jgi:hypothetical protein
VLPSGYFGEIAGQWRRHRKPGKANLTGIKAVKEVLYMMLKLARSPVRSVSALFKEAL